MTEIVERDQSGGRRGKLALFAVIFSGLAVAWFAVAAVGTKIGLWSWQFGLVTMVIGLGRLVIFAALGLAVLAMLLSLVKAPRKRPFMLALGAVLISGLLTGRLIGLGAYARSVPPIHDIQTDWADPVVLSDTLMAARGPEANPVLYGDAAVYTFDTPAVLKGRLISDIQEEAEFDPVRDDEREEAAYGNIEPLIIDAPVDEVFAAAQRLIKARGWAEVTAAPENGMLEATETSTWFGFKDDIALRLRTVDTKTRVDMRSISRVGRSDIGANAKRVEAFLQDLAGQRYTR